MKDPMLKDAHDDSLADDSEFSIEENEDGSADIIPIQKEAPADSEFYSNIAEENEDELKTIIVDMLAHIELDKEARTKRDEQYADAIKRSGLGAEAPGGAEFEGASKVVHPIIAETAIDFAANAIKELFPNDGAVKTKIEGKVTAEKYQKADRKARHMNWQLRKQIKEFRPSLEQILSQIPMAGVQYSKMYYCQSARRTKFEFIPLDDIYIPYNAADFYSATRKTHAQKLSKIEFENRCASGMYIDPEQDVVAGLLEETLPQRANDAIEGKQQVHYDEDGLRLVYEIYCLLELDDAEKSDKIAYAPYILTIDESTEKVLSLYRNWDPEDVTHEPLDWVVEWQFIPWRGAYAIGLHHLIGGLSKAATGSLRALLDSAHINNAPTAIKLKGAQFSGQSAQINITQIHEIDAAPSVDDIRKIAMPLPFNPPSTVLFQLLGFLVEAAKGVIRTTVEPQKDFSPNTPPGTYLAQIEQGMKVYSAIHARLHCSFEKTLDILHRLNKEYLEDGEPTVDKDNKTDFTDNFSEKLAYRSDYVGEMDVQPVSDPNIYSEAQRYGQMQAVGQLAEKYPDQFNRKAYIKSMMQLMKVPNYEELLIQAPEEKDENPVTENIKLATGQPVSALPDQDHLAHLQVHLDFWNSPALGQSPALKPHVASGMLNHIIQTILMLYGSEVKELIEKASGHKIDDLMSDDEEVMLALSKAAAAASPIAINVTQELLSKVIPTIGEMMTYVQSLAPPQPMDPANASLQIAQMQLKNEETKLQATTQIKQADIASREKMKQVDVGTDSAKIQSDQQMTQLELAQKNQSDEMKSATELRKNEEDNITAWKISQLRAESGHVGGLKNGESLGENNFAEGGLVEGDNMPDNDSKSSPIINYVDTSHIAHMMHNHQSQNNLNISDLISELRNHTKAITSSIASIGDNNEDLVDSLRDAVTTSIGKSHKALLQKMNKKPNIKIKMERDKDNKLVANIDSGDDQ